MLAQGGVTAASRTPPGVRGLKLKIKERKYMKMCRTPPGVRGLKLRKPNILRLKLGRTPPGVRGLKLDCLMIS